MHDFAEKIKENYTEDICMFFLGQAGFVIKSKTGHLLAIDIYLSNCVETIEKSKGYHRMIPTVLEADELVFDGVIATHSHYDHYDYDSMPDLLNNKKTKLLASVNCKYEVEKQNIEKEKVIYVSAGEKYQIEDFHLLFIKCDHGEAAKDAVGVLLIVDNVKFLFTGDTCLRLDRLDEMLALGTPDYLIGPINGKYGNMNEEDFSKLSKEIAPRYTIPCHFGMFQAHGGDLKKFVEAMSQLCPKNKYRILSAGDCIQIKR